MKKLNTLLIALFTFSIIMIACKKDDLLNNSNEPSSSEKIIYTLDQIPLKKNNQNVIDLLQISQDQDDEKINFHLYNLSLAIRELTKEKKFNTLIIKLAKNSQNNCANLLDLKTEAPEYFEKINQNLLELSFSKTSNKDSYLDLASIAKELTHEPAAPNPDYPETSETEQYYPAIFIPNLDFINPDLQPIFSPNIEADPTNNEDIEDNIIAWYYTDNGELNEILFSEETSLKTTNPLFFLDNASAVKQIKQNLNAVPFYGNYNLDDFNSTNYESSAKKKKEQTFKSNHVSIKSSSYRYEAIGKSDFCAVATMYYPGVNFAFGPQYSNNYITIENIKKTEIGNIIESWKYHAPNQEPYANSWISNGNQPSRYVVFQNTFERDWNRSTKIIGSCTVGTLTAHLRGNMKYSSEWYT